jgi:hypothetical protein
MSKGERCAPGVRGPVAGSAAGADTVEVSREVDPPERGKRGTNSSESRGLGRGALASGSPARAGGPTPSPGDVGADGPVVMDTVGFRSGGGGGLARRAMGTASGSGARWAADSEAGVSVGRRLGKESLGTTFTEGGGPTAGEATSRTRRGGSGAEGSHAASTRKVGGLVRATIGNLADGAQTAFHYN